MDPVYQVLTDKLKQLKVSGIVINPWLAVHSSKCFTPHVLEFLRIEADNLAGLILSDAQKMQYFNYLPNPANFPKAALCETFMSTAVFIAHEKTGDLFVDEDIAREAILRVIGYCNTHGISNLLHLYQITTIYDNLNALVYYNGIPEQIFISGDWHRPWAKHFLNDDLKMGVFTGLMEVVDQNGERCVQITPKGTENLQLIRQMLEAAGYFAERMSLQHISQFNRLEEYEKLAEEIFPEFMQLRKRLIDFTGIRAGMKVLELGSGTGLLTFEAGLADRIGLNGKLVCIDPSAKMINRARAKLEAEEKNWVELGVGVAEELPFEDDRFDAVIGCAFLHFTNRETALREMRRVTRSGGIIGSFHPLACAFNSFPFFSEWFARIFELASKRREQPKNFLFGPEECLASFTETGLIKIEHQEPFSPMVFRDPDKVIKHIIHGLGLYQEELANLPWKAREEIMNGLKERGISICRKYSEEERIIYQPVQFIKGIVP